MTKLPSYNSNEKWYYCDNCKRWIPMIPTTNIDTKCDWCGKELSYVYNVNDTDYNVGVILTEEEKDYLKMLFEMGDVAMNHIDNNNGYYNLSFGQNDVFRLKEKLGLV